LKQNQLVHFFLKNNRREEFLQIPFPVLLLNEGFPCDTTLSNLKRFFNERDAAKGERVKVRVLKINDFTIVTLKNYNFPLFKSEW